MSVCVRFGPHHVVSLRQENERTRFKLGRTHHGFQADASEISSELDQIITEIERAHRELIVDELDP